MEPQRAVACGKTSKLEYGGQPYSSRILAFLRLPPSPEGWQKRMAEKAKDPKILQELVDENFQQRWN